VKGIVLLDGLSTSSNERIKQITINLITIQSIIMNAEESNNEEPPDYDEEPSDDD